MAKKIFSRLTLLGLMVFFVTGCSKKTEYTHVIPVDATAVVSFDMESLGKKAGLSDAENQQFKLQIIDALKSGLNAATLLHVENILKDPSESGLNLKDRIYIYKSPAFSSPVIVAKVSDEDKLRRTVDLMAGEQVMQPATEVSGFTYSMLNNNTVFAFSNSALIITQVSGGAQQDFISRLLNGENDRTINDNEGFKRMQKRNGDILFYTTLDNLPKGYASQYSMGLSNNNVNLRNVMIAGNVSFEKGKIVVQSEVHSEDQQITDMLKAQENATGKIKGDLMNKFPSSTLAYFSMNVNGEELYKLLRENENFRNTFSVSEAAQVRDLFHSFKGDIGVGLINISMTSTPTFIAFADTDKEVAVNALYDSKSELGLRSGEDILKLAPNEFVFKTRGANIFFGYKDNHIYATNDELLYKNAGTFSGNSLKDARYASNIKGKKQYFIIDIETIAQLPVVKMALAFGGPQAANYYDIASRFSYLEVIGEDSGKSEINIVFRDREENAMKQILDFARALSGL